MRQARFKAFWAWDFDKEEQWITDFAADGLDLVDAFAFRYVFEEGTPGAYEYRLELLENLPTHPGSQRYLRFLEETGIECVSSYGRWVYLRRLRDGVPFDLFSDIDSKVNHLRRILAIVGVALMMWAASGFLYLFDGWSNFQSLAPDDLGLLVGVSLVWLPVGAAVVCGFVRIARKLRRFKRERVVHE